MHSMSLATHLPNYKKYNSIEITSEIYNWIIERIEDLNKFKFIIKIKQDIIIRKPYKVKTTISASLTVKRLFGQTTGKPFMTLEELTDVMHSTHIDKWYKESDIMLKNLSFKKLNNR